MTLKGTPIQGQRGPRSKGNERVVHAPQISRTGTCILFCITIDTIQ